MEGKKRTLLAAAISCIILAAVLYSFFLSIFSNTAKIELADPSAVSSSPLDPSASGDQGGIVVDVAVENPLYGELRGNLNLASRYDVDHFIQQAADTPECLLSRMTGGVHLHTLSCPTPEAFRRIEAALDAKGLLYKKEE